MKRVFPALLWAALLAPLAVEIVCFRSAHLLLQPIWSEAGLHHLRRYMTVFAEISVPLILLLRRYYLAAMATGAVLCSIHAVGPAPVFTVLLFVLSTVALGRLVFGESLEARLAFAAGVSFWIISVTLTARLPMHYPAVYLVALIIPVGLGYRQLARVRLKDWRISYRESLCLALLLFVLIAHWLVVLKPEAGADGLAMHLAVAFEMARRHAFTLDFHHYSWALMPMGSDYCYAVVYALGGEYAARLLNFMMLCAIAVLLFHTARRFASTALALITTALFVSTPMVQNVTGSMFVENFVAAVTLAGVIAMWRYQETRTKRDMLLMTLLLGTAVSLKLSAVAVVVFALLWLIGAGVRPKAYAIAMLVVLGSLPYVNAYWRSGNPIYPFSTTLKDSRFHPPLSVLTPVRLTFETHEYFEGRNGSFGFQYLLLLPITLVCLRVTFKSASLIGTGAALLIALTQPNARYFYVALPLLTLGAAAAVAWVSSHYRLLSYVCVTAMLAAFAANFYFLPASNYSHADFFTTPIFSAAGRSAYQKMYAPVRNVIDYINRVDPSDPVFYSDGSQIAGLLPTAYRNSWHDYAFEQQLSACTRGPDVYRLLTGLGVRYMVVQLDGRERPPAVSAVIAKCGDLEYTLGDFAAFRLRTNCESSGL